MDWLGQIGNIAGKYAGGQDHPDVHDDYDRVAGAAPRGALASGLASAFRSNDTPPFGALVGTLFRNADDQQRSGLLSMLIGAIGPAVATRALGGLLRPGQTSLDPSDMRRIDPSQVEHLAANAEQQDPGIIDRVTDLVAGNPGLAKSLGGPVIGLALSRLGRDH